MIHQVCILAPQSLLLGVENHRQTCWLYCACAQKGDSSLVHMRRGKNSHLLQND